MVPLRIAALGSNVAFVAYGLALGLMPVWLLHAILLPLNARRLFDARTACGYREMACQNLRQSRHGSGMDQSHGSNFAHDEVEESGNPRRGGSVGMREGAPAHGESANAPVHNEIRP
jgi:hypothetical protein